MAPRRQAAKRKSVRDDYSDVSDVVSSSANKKVKRSRRQPTRRSPRLERLYPGAENGRGKGGPSLERTGENGLSLGEDEELHPVRAMAKVDKAASQHRSGQNETRRSAKCLSQFLKKQKSEEDSLTEFVQKKIAQMENFTSAFTKEINSKCSKLSTMLDSPSEMPTDIGAQPLYRQGQETLALCRDILKHYEETNKLTQGEKYALPASSSDEDKGQVLEITNMAAGIGRKLVERAFKASHVGGGGLGIPEPKTDKERLAHSFLAKSLASHQEKPWGEEVWVVWKAWHCISNGIRGSDALHPPPEK
ncbi:hypothetical protein SAPIO_CDS3971 [Scedosporium apiospermum]|uniref:Uncharacterized protein n=1 Tax=Pseudallescheria apiosperma TaxID=563466 RepID=A0A084G904_PSEDA|nr:uncharacterized protein SAPIO_CDS3971 [Scedosporium apiospermum]KEZ43816.1 hypothetical protein SAPIO_CDS3971 [Scedosporium apiospermum]